MVLGEENGTTASYEGYHWQPGEQDLESGESLDDPSTRPPPLMAKVARDV